MVGTRPLNVNGLGWSLPLASNFTADVLTLFPLLCDRPEQFSIWQSLVEKHQISGKLAHDARLVAAMLTHEIEEILTFNVKDLHRFPEIRAIHPSDF